MTPRGLTEVRRFLRHGTRRHVGLFVVLGALGLGHSKCAIDEQPRSENGERELVELGRHLFYERRISLNEDRSCGICHEQAKGFTDGFVRAVGTTGEIHPRNTLSLLNVRARTTLSWLDPQPTPLTKQMLIPLLGMDPVEMGAHDLIEGMLDTLNEDPVYLQLLSKLQPVRSRLDLTLVTEAIAAFVETLVDYDSPYDRHLSGQTDALSALEEEGRALFFSTRTRCSECHGGIDFDAPGEERHGWYNTGLYDLGDGSYPPGRQGLFELTGQIEDTGKYRIPTLRHLRFTGPYYHDGTGATLSNVLRNYNEGGRNVGSGPYVGDGRGNPYKDSRIRPLGLTPSELLALEAFLMSLSNDGILTYEPWSDPWPRDTD